MGARQGVKDWIWRCMLTLLIVKTTTSTLRGMLKRGEAMGQGVVTFNFRPQLLKSKAALRTDEPSKTIPSSSLGELLLLLSPDMRHLSAAEYHDHDKTEVHARRCPHLPHMARLASICSWHHQTPNKCQVWLVCLSFLNRGEKFTAYSEVYHVDVIIGLAHGDEDVFPSGGAYRGIDVRVMPSSEVFVHQCGQPPPFIGGFNYPAILDVQAVVAKVEEVTAGALRADRSQGTTVHLAANAPRRAPSGTTDVEQCFVASGSV